MSDICVRSCDIWSHISYVGLVGKLDDLIAAAREYYPYLCGDNIYFNVGIDALHWIEKHIFRDENNRLMHRGHKIFINYNLKPLEVCIYADLDDPAVEEAQSIAFTQIKNSMIKSCLQQSKYIQETTKASNWWATGIAVRPKIKKVIFNNPATIVFWTDDTKTVVKCGYDPFDPEKGLAMAISKKYFGNEGNYYDQFRKWLE